MPHSEEQTFAKTTQLCAYNNNLKSFYQTQKTAYKPIY